MKKVIFGLLALSTVGFANMSSTNNIPVKVKAEIVAGESSLIIADENGNNFIGDKIVLDHGRIQKGYANDSIVTQKFSVQLKPAYADPANSAVTMNGKLEVSLNDSTATLAKANSTSKLISNLSVATEDSAADRTDMGYDVKLSSNIHVGEIKSVIDKAHFVATNSLVEAGAHANGDSENRLTVTFTPGA